LFFTKRSARALQREFADQWGSKGPEFLKAVLMRIRRLELQEIKLVSDMHTRPMGLNARLDVLSAEDPFSRLHRREDGNDANARKHRPNLPRPPERQVVPRK
jgi:hypothetical protein